MNQKQLSEHIGNMDDRLVRQAEQIPHYAAMRRRKWVRQFSAVAAVLVLMVSSFSVGALAFSRQIAVEAETVTLEELGLTLILPDSWKDQYIVVEDTFVPYDSAMWEFCVKSVYDAHCPADASGDLFYRGTLFTIFQYADCSMSAKEFAQSELAGIGRYLFATEQATYVMLYAGDVQYDPSNEEQAAAYQNMMAELGDIQVVVSTLLAP